MIEFRANGRTAQGYLAMPERGSGPGVIVVQEWWGLVGHVRDVADRFAAAGFVALAPDLYHGEKATSPDEAEKLFMALNIAETLKDFRGAADHLLAMPEVAPKKLGVVGFCMGGQLALYAAGELPDRVGAAVDFYGIHPKVEPRVERVGGPVLMHFGRSDRSIPADRVASMVDRMQAAGKSVEVHWYDAGHAFFNDQRPTVYQPAEAELAWTRTIAIQRKALV